MYSPKLRAVTWTSVFTWACLETQSQKLPRFLMCGRRQPRFLKQKSSPPFTYRVLAPAGWGEQVLGRDWKALAALPWLATPAASAHHRMLARVFGPLGVEPRRVALVDQEASMLDLVRSGVGLSLVRDSIAIREAQARGLVIADRVSLDCDLSFVCLRARAADPVVAGTWSALEKVWR